MRGRATAAVLSLVVSGLLAAAPSARAPAAALDTPIVVAGNRRADAAMIRSFFRADSDGRLDDAALDAALKGLYGTGLFRDVEISRDGDRILVTVAENPTIEKVAFEGNSKIKDDELKKAVQSRAGGPLSRTTVHDDVERMVELYRLHGYFEVRVNPQTIADHERVKLVFEIAEGSKLAVRRITFAGANAFTANKLRGVIKTGETNFLSFLLDNDIYDADRIDADCAQLRGFYRAHGYADALVRSAASYDAAAKGVVVTFTIDEGRQYRFGRVEIESSMQAVDAASLRAHLRTAPGAIYDADEVDKTVADLTIGLARSGEPFATVAARTERLPERQLINVVYTVEQGKRLYVERIDIHGNGKTRDDVIRREFDFAEGDAYNRALIERAERRLKRLGYFETVRIDTEPGSAPDRVVVKVAVEEQKTGNFSVMGGYSAATGPTVEIGVTERNFLGSGDIVSATLTYGEFERGFDVGFTDPYALGARLSLGADLFAKQALASDFQSFTSTFYGAKVSAGMPLSDQLGVAWSYSIYNQGLTLDPAAATPASLPIQQAAAAGPMWVSSVGTGLTYSTLDNPRNPTDGVRVQTNNEFAGLGGAAKFARTTEDARYYHEIVGDVVGMTRAQAGYVTPWGGQQLPLLDGFFGGPQLVRGFAPNGFGPRDLTPGTAQDNVGGNIFWTTTAELQAPMPLVTPDARLKVALFSDAGSLWATNASSVASLASLSPAQQIANARALRASVGASLIWDSPFGAIRVDYAIPVAKQSYDVVQPLNFTAGGF
jgi:outer membrane protein insertion porin family